MINLHLDLSHLPAGSLHTRVQKDISHRIRAIGVKLSPTLEDFSSEERAGKFYTVVALPKNATSATPARYSSALNPSIIEVDVLTPALIDASYALTRLALAPLQAVGYLDQQPLE